MSLRSALRTAGAQVGTNYERAMKFVRDSLQAGQYYNAKGEMGKDDGGVAPMDVGAVSYDKGKKVVSPRMRKESTKVASLTRRESHRLQRSSMVSAPTVAKWGHKKADYRLLAKEKAKREGKGKGNSTNAITAASSSIPSRWTEHKCSVLLVAR